MILVDSSVWIANLRGKRSEAVRKLRDLEQEAERIIIGDLIVMGARDEAHAVRLRRELREFRIVPLMDSALAEEAARNYRLLRGLGFTIRTGMMVG